MSFDESINLAKNKRVSGLEKLDSSYANWVVGVFVFDVTLVGAILNVLGWTQCGGDEKSNIVTRVGFHDMCGTQRCIELVYFPIRVLNH